MYLSILLPCTSQPSQPRGQRSSITNQRYSIVFSFHLLSNVSIYPSPFYLIAQLAQRLQRSSITNQQNSKSIYLFCLFSFHLLSNVSIYPSPFYLTAQLAQRLEVQYHLLSLQSILLEIKVHRSNTWSTHKVFKYTRRLYFLFFFQRVIFESKIYINKNIIYKDYYSTQNLQIHTGTRCLQVDRIFQIIYQIDKQKICTFKKDFSIQCW